jgi:hypothetical protein
MDTSTNKKITDIAVGGSPLAISFNPVTKILYVTNLYYNAISEILDNKILAGVSFNVKPLNAGNIVCDQKSISNSDYERYPVGLYLHCKATTNSGFLFSSWTNDFARSNNNTDTTFKISRFGNVTANFIMPVQLSFPKQYWEGLYLLLLSVIVPAVASWFVPSVAGWLNSWRQRRNLSKCITAITRIHDKYKEDEDYSKRLEQKRDEIVQILTKGKISESHYNILDRKISEYEQKLKK